MFDTGPYLVNIDRRVSRYLGAPEKRRRMRRKVMRQRREEKTGDTDTPLVHYFCGPVR